MCTTSYKGILPSLPSSSRVQGLQPSLETPPGGCPSPRCPLPCAALLPVPCTWLWPGQPSGQTALSTLRGMVCWLPCLRGRLQSRVNARHTPFVASGGHFPPWILGGGLRQGLTSPLQALPRTGSPANIPLQDTCPLTTSCLAQGAGEGGCHLPELAGEDRGTGAHKLWAS